MSSWRPPLGEESRPPKTDDGKKQASDLLAIGRIRLHNAKRPLAQEAFEQAWDLDPLSSTTAALFDEASSTSGVGTLRRIASGADSQPDPVGPRFGLAVGQGTGDARTVKDFLNSNTARAPPPAKTRSGSTSPAWPRDRSRIGPSARPRRSGPGRPKGRNAASGWTMPSTARRSRPTSAAWPPKSRCLTLRPETRPRGAKLYQALIDEGPDAPVP